MGMPLFALVVVYSLARDPRRHISFKGTKWGALNRTHSDSEYNLSIQTELMSYVCGENATGYSFQFWGGARAKETKNNTLLFLRPSPAALD